MLAVACFLPQASPLPIDVLDVVGQACLCSAILGFYPELEPVYA